MFEYTLEIEDRVAYQLWFLDSSGKAARIQRRMWLTGLGACLLIFGVPVSFIVGRTTGPMNPILGLFVTWVLCTPIWLAVVTIWPNLTRAWLTRRATTAIRRGRRNRPEGVVRLWLDETGVNCTSNGLSTHRAWSSITGVGESSSHLFIQIQEQVAYILPKRLGPGAVMAVATQLRAQLAPGVSPVPQRGTWPSPSPEAEPLAPATAPGGPDGWVPPVGVVPLSAFVSGAPSSYPVAPSSPEPASFPTTALPMLTFTVSIDDLRAAVLDFPPALEWHKRFILRDGWRRWAIRSVDGFVLLLLCNLFVFRLGTGWAMASAAGVMGAFALVRWSQLDHVIKRALPAAVEQEARNKLAARSDQRRVWADAGGLTIGDAVITQQLRWAQVQVAETDRHVILGTELVSVAIPRQVGQPLANLLRFARSCGVG